MQIIVQPIPDNILVFRVCNRGDVIFKPLLYAAEDLFKDQGLIDFPRQMNIDISMDIGILLFVCEREGIIRILLGI